MSTKSVELVADTFGYIITDKLEHEPVKRFTWKNANRIQVQAITYGATVISIKYPNKKGIVDDVLLGFDDMKAYLENFYYNFGSTIGRCANFIKNSTFHIQKKDYVLSSNMGKHHYNGGKKGFDQVNWNYFISGNKVIMSYLSVDNEEGYPGDLLVFAIYELTNQNEFKMEYKATTSKPTIVNIANHCYFNLAGHSGGEEEINKHTVLINADCHTVAGEDLLPTGEIQSVLQTVYDFQIPVSFRTLFDKLDGFNKNFCINRGADQGVCFVARLTHLPSGRILEVYSNQNGVEFDTANTFPIRAELEPSSTKIAKCPYLKSGVSSFDMLDEIYNKVADCKLVDQETNYDDILILIQDLQKKGKQLHRTSSHSNGNSTIKRSALCIENLPIINLTSLQVKYIDRILQEVVKVEESNKITEVKVLLENVLVCQKKSVSLESTVSSEGRRMKSDVSATNKIIRGKKGAKYYRHSGVCLQCQNYPDAVNHAKFPSTVLKPGTVYDHITVFKFWIKTDQSGISGIL